MDGVAQSFRAGAIAADGVFLAEILDLYYDAGNILGAKRKRWMAVSRRPVNLDGALASSAPFARGTLFK